MTTTTIPVSRLDAAERTRRIDEACLTVARFQGQDRGEELRSEMIGKSDAYVAARCDAVAAELPRYEREAFHRELVAAGNRAESARRHRFQAFREDAATPSAMESAVRWPIGFDRAKAIVVLQAAGLAPSAVRGSMYTTLAGASDAWLVGALNQLLDSQFVSQQLDDQLIKCGYGRQDGVWRYRVTPTARPSTAAPALPFREDGGGDDTKPPLSWREQWKAGLD